MLYIEEVMLELGAAFLHRRSISRGYLGPTCNSRPDYRTKRKERNILSQLSVDLRTLGPWSDEAHFALHDIPELRNLVEPGGSHESADRGNSWIVRASPLWSVGFGVSAHASEFHHHEGLAQISGSGLLVENRARTRKLDQNGANDDRR
jgi:hypothetical protein